VADTDTQESDPSQRVPSVSVVIPTVGRSCVADAVRSALAQRSTPAEVLVCLDGEEDISALLPSDPRVKLLRVGPFAGGNAARQAGIAAANGELVALLDDDDLWLPAKLDEQLRLVSRQGNASVWVATSRVVALTAGDSEIWPTDMLRVEERLTAYILRKHRVRGGVGFVQTSTLLFPRRLALEVPWQPERRFHQDLQWLIDLERRYPNLTVLQCNEPLTVYTATGLHSVSRTVTPAQSSAWAVETIRDDARSLGDFLLTGPVVAAARRGNPREAVAAIRLSLKIAKPGPPSLVFAAGQLAISVKRAAARRFQRG
jgi:glycosyltransferase involved in cell wall biosynthesis